MPGCNRAVGYRGSVARRAPHLGPARRRGPVLDAALTVFAEGGFAAASMSSIAEQAGVAKAVLYDCFPGGKEELYTALLDRVEQGFVDHMARVQERIRGLPLMERVAEGIEGFLEWAEVNPLAFRVVFGGAGSRDPRIAERVERTREAVIATLRDQTATENIPSASAALDVAELYSRSIVAVCEELARWSLRRPDLSRRALAQLTALWMVKGFERLQDVRRSRGRTSQAPGTQESPTSR